MTHAAWIVAPLLTLLTLAPALVTASTTIGPQTVTEKDKDKNVVVKTTDAVVKGAKVAADKTEDALSKTGEVMTDAWITARVSARFVDEDLLKGSDINVDTKKHVVTLKGTVMGRAGRTKASDIAKRTEGVRRVVNQLTIGPKRGD